MSILDQNTPQAVTEVAPERPNRVLAPFLRIAQICGSVKGKIGETIDNVVFRPIAHKLMTTLLTSKLSHLEMGVINESIVGKYVPVMRNSVLMAMMATPGMLGNMQSFQMLLSAIIAVTGVAWFTVSLEKVKDKFIDFGVELTGNMLQSFLTSLFLMVAAGLAMGGAAEAESYLQIARDTGIDPNFILQKAQELAQNPYFKAIANIASLAVVGSVVKNLVAAVIKYDAIDAMLTGAAGNAMTFYAQSISDLRAAALFLKTDHKIDAANYQIVQSLKLYKAGLEKSGVQVESGIEKTLEELDDGTSNSQEQFDKVAIPLIVELLGRYELLVSDDPVLKMKFQGRVGSLNQLLDSYNGTPKSQQYADNVIADSLMLLSDLLREFGEELVGKEQTAQPQAA